MTAGAGWYQANWKSFVTAAYIWHVRIWWNQRERLSCIKHHPRCIQEEGLSCLPISAKPCISMLAIMQYRSVKNFIRWGRLSWAGEAGGREKRLIRTVLRPQWPLRGANGAFWQPWQTEAAMADAGWSAKPPLHDTLGRIATREIARACAIS